MQQQQPDMAPKVNAFRNFCLQALRVAMGPSVLGDPPERKANIRAHGEALAPKAST